MAKETQQERVGLFLLNGTRDEKWLIKRAYHISAGQETPNKDNVTQNDFLMGVILKECNKIIKKGK